MSGFLGRLRDAVLSSAWWWGPGLLALVLMLDVRNGEHVLDDGPAVRDNPRVTHPSARTIWGESYWPGEHDTLRLYRPVATGSFALVTSIWGNEAGPQREVNLLLHVLVTVLLCLLVAELGSPRWLAASAGLLFAAHPMHVEAVASAANRSELLVSLGALGLLLSYRRLRGESGARETAWQGLALGSFALALLSKENGVTLLVLPWLHDVFLRAGKHDPFALDWLRRLRAFHLAFLFVALAYLMLRWVAIGDLPPKEVAYWDNPLASEGLVGRVIGALAVVARLLGAFLLPARLRYDYGAGIIESPGLASPLPWLGLLVIGGIAWLTWWSHRRGPRALGFWLIFVACTYSIVSNLLVPIGVGMADRLLYLPSLGLCVAAAWCLRELLAWLRFSWPLARVFALTLGGVLLVHSTWTVFRVQDWRSDRSLMLADVAQEPASAKVHYNAGWVLLETDPARASRHLEQSIAIHETARSLHLLSRAHDSLGQEGQRQQVLARLAQDHADKIWGRLASGFQAQKAGRHEEALEHFEAVAQAQPDDLRSRSHVGICLHNLGRHEEAAAKLAEAAGLSGDSERRRLVALSGSLLRIGRLEEVMELVGSLREHADEPQLHENLGFAAYQLGRYDEALPLLERYVELVDSPRAQVTAAVDWLRRRRR
ncbi:MAG: tetratricopeptide repeat protein [Acidobacteriota bacterium]